MSCEFGELGGCGCGWCTGAQLSRRSFAPSQGLHALSQQTGNMYARHTACPFLLIDTKPFAILPLCYPPLPTAKSRFSIAIGLLAISHPPADVDADPRRPHSCSTTHLKFYLVRAHPRFRSCTAALHVHHPGSPTGTLPDADLRCHWHFCSLDLAASHGPCAAPPTHRDFGTHSHAHCFCIPDTDLYSILAFSFAFAVARSPTTCATKLVLPPPTLHCALHAHRPHLCAALLDSGCQPPRVPC
jgi:hypothetical protein